MSVRFLALSSLLFLLANSAQSAGYDDCTYLRPNDIHAQAFCVPDAIDRAFVRVTGKPADPETNKRIKYQLMTGVTYGAKTIPQYENLLAAELLKQVDWQKGREAQKTSIADVITRGYQRVLGRLPTNDELRFMMAWDSPPSTDQQIDKVLQAILASDERERNQMARRAFVAKTGREPNKPEFDGLSRYARESGHTYEQLYAEVDAAPPPPPPDGDGSPPLASGCTIILVHGLGANEGMWLNTVNEMYALNGYDVSKNERWIDGWLAGDKGIGTLGGRGLDEILRERGYTLPAHAIEPSYTYPLRFSSNTKLSFERQAQELSEHIDESLRRTRTAKAILVGHSMGGIASIRYIETKGAAKVAGVVTFGTPYVGSPSSNLKVFLENIIPGCWAGPNCSSDLGVQSLSVGSSAIRALGENLSSVPSTLPIYSIIVGEPRHLWESYAGPTFTDGDGVVTTGSQSIRLLRDSYLPTKQLNFREIFVRSKQAFATIDLYTINPFAHVSGEIHTKEARDPHVQQNVIDAITEIQWTQCH